MSKFNKVSKNFRLSFETIAFIEAVAKKKGITETHVLESAVSEFAISELTTKEREEVIMKKLKEIMGKTE